MAILLPTKKAAVERFLIPSVTSTTSTDDVDIQESSDPFDSIMNTSLKRKASKITKARRLASIGLFSM
jgi:hypothetical protein